MALGLLMALATLLGAAFLCAHGPAMQPEPTAVAMVTYDQAHHTCEHACAAPGHDQCGAASAVNTPATGPGPHPQPLSPPSHVDARSTVVSTTVARYTATPRAPDLYVLQVLRT
ncbi:hypothetical protein HEP87_52180 [Streptomyces sp. S1D4-11]